MVTQEHFKTLEQYADLSAQIKALEEARKAIKSEAMSIVSQTDEGKLDVNGVTLTVGTRKKWSYPYPIKEMEDELKQAKKDAEADGEATCEHTHYLICKV